MRTSVTACSIDKKNTFSAPFGIFYVRTEIWKETFQKNHLQIPNGVHLVFKLPFPNGSYRNGVCKALWAKGVIRGIFSSFSRTECLFAGYYCWCTTIHWNWDVIFIAEGKWVQFLYGCICTAFQQTEVESYVSRDISCAQFHPQIAPLFYFLQFCTIRIAFPLKFWSLLNFNREKFYKISKLLLTSTDSFL